MADGAAALTKPDVAATIEANAGGPYGSGVLAAVQAASEKVWATVQGKGDTVEAGSEVDDSWLKATIRINGHESERWTAHAVGVDGSICGKTFVFDNDH